MKQQEVESLFSQIKANSINWREAVCETQKSVEPTVEFALFSKAVYHALTKAKDEDELLNYLINSLLSAITIGYKVGMAEGEAGKMEEMFK